MKKTTVVQSVWPQRLDPSSTQPPIDRPRWSPACQKHVKTTGGSRCLASGPRPALDSASHRSAQVAPSLTTKHEESHWWFKVLGIRAWTRPRPSLPPIGPGGSQPPENTANKMCVSRFLGDCARNIARQAQIAQIAPLASQTPPVLSPQPSALSTQ